MLVTPYYNKPPQEGLFRHFMAAADASAVPVVMYNVPSRTAVDLQPGHRRAACPAPAHQGAQGCERAVLTRVRELLAACPAGFSVLSGDDATAVDWMGAGAHGVISVTANVVPRRMHEASSAALDGRSCRRACHRCATLQPLHRDLFVEANPIPVKWAVAQMGLIGNAIRSPLVELSPAHHETVLRAMRSAGVQLEDRAA